jgi:uncharacterized membrane protein
MKTGKICFGLFMILLAVNIVSASSYSIEFSQVNDKLVVKESQDNIQISNQVSKELLEKSSQWYYFVEKLVFNQSYSQVEVKLNLDNGFIISKDEVFPAGYEIQSDGETISIVWKLNSVKSGDVFPMFVKIKDLNQSYDILWIVITIIILGAIAYMAFRKKSNKPIAKKVVKKTARPEKADDKEYNHLLDTEKKVIDELKKADRNELWQKQIQNSTGFSKAKVSRLVRNLEARKLISKIPFGNTNKVRLK